MNYEQSATHITTITKHTRAKRLDVACNNVTIQSLEDDSYEITVDGRRLENVAGFRLSADGVQPKAYRLSVDFIAGAM